MMITREFESSLIRKLFPFYLVTDKDGVIVEAGPSIQKLINPADGASHFDVLFEVDRPHGLGISDLLKIEGDQMIVVNLVKPKARFMGQMVDLPGSTGKLFLMNLAIQDADELAELKLTFNDFALQDPIFDYLMLLQTQRRAISQAVEANEKLKGAHKIAVEASETKSRFLANMSHELRTPMNGVIGMASILLETNLDDDQRDYVQTMIQSGEAMLALVNDILDLSKIEAGYIQLNPEKMEVDELIAEVFSTMEPVSRKKNLKLNFTLDRNVPKSLIADRTRLRQVLMNLVGNAVKFTSEGHVSLTMATRRDFEGRRTLWFRVQDTGIGMSPTVIESLFSPFVQGDDSSVRKFEGTGLGLSICKRLIEAMEGIIQVQSTEGRGSEFTVMIPVAEGSPAPERMYPFILHGEAQTK